MVSLNELVVEVLLDVQAGLVPVRNRHVQVHQHQVETLVRMPFELGDLLISQLAIISSFNLK